MWEARFNHCCNNVNKLNMHLTKLKMEKDFYKRLYRQHQLEDAQNASLGDIPEFNLINQPLLVDLKGGQKAKPEKYP